jgi:lipid-A-disaccharide synthase
MGVEMVYPPPLNVLGFIEVILKISHLYKAFQKVKKAWVEHKPDLLILIDYPDMNLRLAKAAHKKNIPVLYYISPQVWAWRSGRVKHIVRYVDRMAVILPFEVDFYQAHGVKVEFVGHPLLDRIQNRNPEDGFSISEPILIGLFPGSRPAEVETILPVLLETAARLTGHLGPKVRFVLPVAATLEPAPIKERIRPYQDQGIVLDLASEDSQKTLSRCHIAIVASGTVTLEAAILGIPILIVYKVSPINYWIARHLIHVPYVGLVNWVAGHKMVPEYIQEEAVPEAIMDGALRFLEDPGYYQSTRNQLLAVGEKLGRPGASVRVAQLAREMMH